MWLIMIKKHFDKISNCELVIGSRKSYNFNKKNILAVVLDFVDVYTNGFDVSIRKDSLLKKKKSMYVKLNFAFRRSRWRPNKHKEKELVND